MAVDLEEFKDDRDHQEKEMIIKTPECQIDMTDTKTETDIAAGRQGLTARVTLTTDDRGQVHMIDIIEVGTIIGGSMIDDTREIAHGQGLLSERRHLRLREKDNSNTKGNKVTLMEKEEVVEAGILTTGKNTMPGAQTIMNEAPNRNLRVTMAKVVTYK